MGKCECGQCPHCGSWNIAGYSKVHDHDEGVVYYGRCKECDGYFEEIDELQHLENKPIEKKDVPEDALRELGVDCG